MYDAIDDPYTYENSTVLVNKLDLRDQDELDGEGNTAAKPSTHPNSPLPGTWLSSSLMPSGSSNSSE